MSNSIENKEIEFKYSAKDLPLLDFINFGKAQKDGKFLTAKGTDYFYAAKNDFDIFCRHRYGEDSNQFTYKRKLHSKNNFIRVEHNVDLDPKTTPFQIMKLANDLGFEYNTKIDKLSYVYKYKTHVLAYYICYNDKRQELGRFFEIEIAEDFPWKNQTTAYKLLQALEKKCKALGITPKHRLKQSLWEMFRKTKLKNKRKTKNGI